MHRDQADHEGVLEAAEHVVQRRLGDGQRLRPEVSVELRDRERADGVGQQVALEAPQGRHVRDAVALDDVAQQHHVHVPPQEGYAVERVEASCFREAADRQVAAKGGVDGGARVRSEPGVRRDRLVAGVA